MCYGPGFSRLKAIIYITASALLWQGADGLDKSFREGRKFHDDVAWCTPQQAIYLDG